MAVVSTILTVLFVIVSVLLILLILLQSNRSAGMGFMGAASQTAFGSSSGDILTKITAVLATSFMVMALLLAMIMSKSTSTSDLEKEITASEVPAAPKADGVAPSGETAPETKPEATPGTATTETTAPTPQ